MEALQCLTIPTSQSKIQEYKDASIWSETVRRIYEHDHSEGRCENYPYFGEPSSPLAVVYKDKDGKPGYEFKGLLGLTGRNGDTIPRITHNDVIHYINELIEERILILNEKLQKLPKPTAKPTAPLTEHEKNQQQYKLLESMFVMFQPVMISSIASNPKQIVYQFDLDLEEEQTISRISEI